MTNDLIKSVAKKLDDLCNFNKWVPGIAGNIIEIFDGKMFEGLLMIFNEKVYSKLSAAEQNDVDTLLTAFVTGDRSLVDEALINRVNALIDIPELNEEEEAELFGGLIKAIFKYIQRKSGGEAATKDGGQNPDKPRGGEG